MKNVSSAPVVETLRDVKGAKSLCTCGHIGDSTFGHSGNGSHAGEIGHGYCRSCSCEKFTWLRYLRTDEYIQSLT